MTNLYVNSTQNAMTVYSNTDVACHTYTVEESDDFCEYIDENGGIHKYTSTTISVK